MTDLNNVKTILVMFLSVTQAVGFNIVNPTTRNTFSSDVDFNTDFGYSVAISSHDNKYWLYIGAPKEGAANDSARALRDGSVYSCQINAPPESGIGGCTNLNLADNHVNGSGSRLLTINFEDTLLEQLNQTDDFDWYLHSSGTASSETGPTFDHTFSNGAKGRYMYVESSLPRAVGEAAVMSTQQLPQTTGACVRFWYHMYGKTMGSLNVYVSSKIIGTRMVWTISGNQNETWHEAWITVISEEPYKILFEGVIGQGIRSDIALDDIVVHSGSCVEDKPSGRGSLGMTLKKDISSGNILSCAPTWTYSCKDQDYMTGLCYFLKGNPNSLNVSMMSPCRYPVCNINKMDLVFLIDGSDSINSVDFKNMVSWLRNVISSLSIVKDLTRIGIAQFSSTARTEFHLNQYHKLEDFRQAIKNITHMKGNTETGRAISYMNQEMFNEENGMRPDAEHVAVVITDGKSQDNVISASKAVKSRGITIFAIGVSSANESELNDISSDPDDQFVFSVRSYNALDGIRSRLQEKLFLLESQSNSSTFSTEQCQAGISATFIQGHPVIGLPGFQDWSGGFTTYLQGHSISTKIGLKDILEKDDQKTMDHFMSANHSTSSPVIKNSYFGSSMSSGSYSHVNSKDIVVGSPGLHSKGGVFVLNVADAANPMLSDHFVGDQLGSNFGFSVCMTDMNNDGLSELLVGSPLFCDRHPDEGRVAIFISNGDDRSKKRERLKIGGSREGNARFGFSIAATGDLNGDGYGDIAIGAPDGIDGDGIVFIYNGRKDLKTMLKPSQIIRSSSLKSKPVLFGFSIDSGIDVDGNSYPDIAVGSPGSGEAFVMLSRPVIHVSATIRSIPGTVNISKSTCFLPEKFSVPFIPKACSTVELCFSVRGSNIPQVILLEYKLIVDEKLSRAIAVNPRNEIIATDKASCVSETLAFKEAMFDFSPVVVEVHYKLSSKLNYTDESAMLNIYDENPVKTEIGLTRWCKNTRCESDLKVKMSYQGLVVVNGMESLLLEDDKTITLNVELKNTGDIALLPTIELLYHSALYLSHITQEKACISMPTGSVNVPDTLNRRHSHCPKPNCTTNNVKMKRMMLQYINPIMKMNSLCKFQLKFGIADEKAFYEDHMTISLHSNSSSKDLDEADNSQYFSYPVRFTTKPSLKGYTDRYEVRLQDRGNFSNLTTSLSDIGPHVAVTFFVGNVGPWEIPLSSLQIRWPNVTVDNNMILYPVDMNCSPKDKCVCLEQPGLFNPLNLTKLEKYNSSIPDFNNSAAGIHLTNEITMDCEKDLTQCSQTTCTISNLVPQDVVQLSIHFRIWERMVFDLKAWKANVIITALLASLSHEHHVSQPSTLSNKVSFAALGSDVDPNKIPGSGVLRLWVVFVAVGAGLALLALVVLLLYKAKFFESKYQQKKAETLKWGDYRYPSLQEGRIQIQLKEAGKETIITRLSTFQR